MSWFAKSKDHLPVTWWKGHPVYFAAIVALAGVGSMVVTALVMAAYAPLLEHTVFTWRGLADQFRLWTIVTYVLVNPPSIWVVISSVMLWRFGEDVEKFFGRRVFVKLLVILLLAEPLVLSLIGLITSMDGFASGIFFIEFGVFIAFATLYPTAKLNIIICCIDAWIIAAVIVAVNALESLAGRQWSALFLLVTQVGVAYGFVRVEQGRWVLPSLSAWFKKQGALRQSAKHLRVVRDGSNEDVSEIGVDAILEKISRQGMNSLTAKERRTLEKASDDLKGR